MFLLLYILLMWRMWTMLKKKLKQEKLYLIAATILVISSLIRLYNLYFSDATIEGSEDYAL